MFCNLRSVSDDDSHVSTDYNATDIERKFEPPFAF